MSRCGGCRSSTTTRSGSPRKVADADNAAGVPGAITAALFLQHFIERAALGAPRHRVGGDSPKDEFEYTKGATGFGARALLHWLELREPLAGVGGG